MIILPEDRLIPLLMLEQKRKLKLLPKVEEFAKDRLLPPRYPYNEKLELRFAALRMDIPLPVSKNARTEIAPPLLFEDRTDNDDPITVCHLIEYPDERQL
jgi:hypothetical protein